jgi:hypothetical protein
MTELFRIRRFCSFFNPIISYPRRFLIENFQTGPTGKIFETACCFHTSNIVPSAVDRGRGAWILDFRRRTTWETIQ